MSRRKLKFLATLGALDHRVPGGTKKAYDVPLQAVGELSKILPTTARSEGKTQRWNKSAGLNQPGVPTGKIGTLPLSKRKRDLWERW